jgi:hypothetical protein
MTFKIAPTEYRLVKVTYNEALLYCFTLNIDGEYGWRLPTQDEYKTFRPFANSWAYGDLEYLEQYELESQRWQCIPVK